jgi:hypothetical protein
MFHLELSPRSIEEIVTTCLIFGQGMITQRKTHTQYFVFTEKKE